MATTCTWDSGTIKAGQNGVASWSGVISPTGLDWLALHKVGAPTSDYLVWQLITVPVTISAALGEASGSRLFVVPPTAAAGSYTVQLYRGYSGALLAESAAFTVNAYDNFISISGPASASVNTSLTATWAGIDNPSGGDWVALVDQTFVDTPAAFAVQALTGGSAAGAISLAIPNATPPGAYELRLYSGRPQALIRLATSGTITLTSTARVTIASPGDQLAGTLVAAQWANIVSPAPSTQDWVGLFAIGAPSSAPVGNRYLNGAASGSLPFVIPGYLPTASYELRLYSGADQSLLATSAAFTVTAAP